MPADDTAADRLRAAVERGQKGFEVLDHAYPAAGDALLALVEAVGAIPPKQPPDRKRPLGWYDLRIADLDKIVKARDAVRDALPPLSGGTQG